MPPAAPCLPRLACPRLVYLASQAAAATVLLVTASHRLPTACRAPCPPPAAQVEKDNAFEVKADIPGVKKENIKVTGAWGGWMGKCRGAGGAAQLAAQEAGGLSRMQPRTQQPAQRPAPSSPAHPPPAPHPPAVDKDVLRINVEQAEEKKDEGEEGGRKWHRYERSSQFVGRALRMPEAANLEGIKARYDNGVLVLDGAWGGGRRGDGALHLPPVHALPVPARLCLQPRCPPCAALLPHPSSCSAQARDEEGGAGQAHHHCLNRGSQRNAVPPQPAVRRCSLRHPSPQPSSIQTNPPTPPQP
jgi:HSP20 family molecular chaperone IbpA